MRNKHHFSKEIKMSIDSNLIKHASYKIALEAIELCHESHRRGIKPKNLLILGVSGVGKSTLLKTYRDRYDRYDLDELTIVPVLYICLPSSPVDSAIYGELLSVLGDAFPFKGKVSDQRSRIIKLCKKCRVELLIIDEVHHFLDRGRLRTHVKSADTFKVLIEAIELPIVLAGAPRSHELFRTNNQIRGRFKTKKSLPPFSIFTDQSKSTFKNLMKAMLRNSTFKNIDFFADEQKLIRLFYATDGVLRNVADLMCLAEEAAQKEKTSVLSFRLLQTSFESWILSDLRFKNEIHPNPFAKGFSERRLTLPNEMYEPTELDGDNHGWK